MNDIAVIEEKVLTTPEKAKAIRITNSESFTEAGNMLLGIKDLRKEIDATFDPIISKAYTTHKEAVAQKKKVEAPLADAEAILKLKLGDYAEAQEKIRRAEELRIQEELRKQEEEQRLNEIEQEIKGGNIERAEEIFQEPVHVPPVILPKSTPKVSGISTKKKWKFTMIDPSKVNRTFLIPDETKIRRYVEDHGPDSVNVIGGIQVYQDTIVAAGRR